jgi:hypothetical protein
MISAIAKRGDMTPGDGFRGILPLFYLFIILPDHDDGA